jgi:hypothetical protein
MVILTESEPVRWVVISRFGKRHEVRGIHSPQEGCFDIRDGDCRVSGGDAANVASRGPRLRS